MEIMDAWNKLMDKYNIKYPLDVDYAYNFKLPKQELPIDVKFKILTEFSKFKREVIEPFKQSPVYIARQFTIRWNRNPYRLQLDFQVDGSTINTEECEEYTSHNYKEYKADREEADIEAAEICDEIHLFNKVDSEFDIVVYVTTHGKTSFGKTTEGVGARYKLDSHGKSVVAKRGFQIYTPPPDHHVTFLQATPVGITNFGTCGRDKQFKKFFRQLLLHKKINLNTLQEFLRKSIVRKLPKDDDSILYLTRANWDFYKDRYTNRYYTRDPRLSKSDIEVIYDKHKHYLGHDIYDDVLTHSNKLSMVLRTREDEITRNELLSFLYDNGYTHPLIIDTSCAYAKLSTRELRAVATDATRKQVAGRTRKR